MSNTGDRKKRIKREEVQEDVDVDSNAMDQLNDNNFTKRCFLRSGYLSIQNFIRDKRDEIAATSSQKFLSIVNEVDEMHHLVTKPREQVSDAEALRDLASALVTSIRVHSTGSVTPSVLVSSLITEYGRKENIGCTQSAGQILWKELGLHVSPFLLSCQGSCTMLGAMTRETQTPNTFVRQKRRRSSVKQEKVKPEKIDLTTTSNDKRETEKIIATMFDTLRSNKNIRLENLILNRISFSQTVENLFALSFLVKDGRVVIAVDEKGSHHVSPRNAPASGMIKSGKVAYSHFIFRVGFDDWKLMKDLVAQGSELMPHRTKMNFFSSVQSELNPKANNSSSARATTKTLSISSNLGMDTDTSTHEVGSGSINEIKWRLVGA